MLAYVHMEYSTYQFSEESKGGGWNPSKHVIELLSEKCFNNATNYEPFGTHSVTRLRIRIRVLKEHCTGSGLNIRIRAQNLLFLSIIHC